MTDHKALPIEEALDAVKERGSTYGDAFVNHERIAAFWRVILEKPNIKPEQVAQCMVAVKLARLVETPGHYDSYVDICGYAGVANACAATQAEHDQSARDVQDFLDKLDEEEIEERAKEKAKELAHELIREHRAAEDEAQFDTVVETGVPCDTEPKEWR